MTQTGFDLPRALDMRYVRLEPFGPWSIDPELTTEGSNRRQAGCSLSQAAESI
jgi:hypothetical protein